jgi:hypothetical protein
LTRVLIVVIAVLLALPSLGLAKPRKRPPKAKPAKAPAADIRGEVKEERGKKPLAAEAGGDEKKRRPGSREKDPRMEAPGKEGGAVGGGNPALQRGTRLEFDGRLVQGQTARSGAVYLFERSRSELRSMVRERQSYRDEIVKTVFPEKIEPMREAPKR